MHCMFHIIDYRLFATYYMFCITRSGTILHQNLRRHRFCRLTVEHLPLACSRDRAADLRQRRLARGNHRSSALGRRCLHQHCQDSDALSRHSVSVLMSNIRARFQPTFTPDSSVTFPTLYMKCWSFQTRYIQAFQLRKELPNLTALPDAVHLGRCRWTAGRLVVIKQ